MSSATTVLSRRDRPLLPAQLRPGPPVLPEPGPAPRLEGIVQAILTWLDGQL